MKVLKSSRVWTAAALMAVIVLSSGCSTGLMAQNPPLKPTGLFDRSEVILVWDEGTTNGARVLEQNLKLKFNYQGMDEGERLIGAEKVVSDTTWSYSRRQMDLVAGDFNGDNMADYLYSLPAGMYIVSFATKNYSQHTRLLID